MEHSFFMADGAHEARRLAGAPERIRAELYREINLQEATLKIATLVELNWNHILHELENLYKLKDLESPLETLSAGQ